MKTNRHGEEDSVHTDNSPHRGNTDEENSYFTYYSDSSMGLAKRQNKQLTMVAYMPVEGDEERQESSEQEDSREPVCITDDAEEEHQVTARHMPPASHLVSSSHDLSSSSSNSDRHTDSTQRTRNASRGVRKPSRFQLAVIADEPNLEEKKSGSFSMAERYASPNRANVDEPDNNAPLSPNSKSDGESRNRRRERLARMARTKEPRVTSPRKQAIASFVAKKKVVSETKTLQLSNKASQRKHGNYQERQSEQDPLEQQQFETQQLEQQQLEEKQLEQQLVQKKEFEQQQLKKQLEQQLLEQQALEQQFFEQEQLRQQELQQRQQLLQRQLRIQQQQLQYRQQLIHKQQLQQKKEEQELKGFYPQIRQAQESEHSAQWQKTGATGFNFQESRNKYGIMMAQARQHHPKKLGSPTAGKECIGSVGSTHSGESDTSSYFMNTHSPLSNSARVVDQPAEHNMADDFFVDYGDRAATGTGMLSPVVEERVASDDSTMGTNVHYTPCMTLANNKNDEGPAACSTTCKSFVNRVWDTCGLSGYQTEGNGRLPQLEMIAEQSVSTIFHGNDTPEAFSKAKKWLLRQQQQQYSARFDDTASVMSNPEDETESVASRSRRAGKSWVAEEEASQLRGEVIPSVSSSFFDSAVQNNKIFSSLSTELQNGTQAFARVFNDDGPVMDDIRHMLDSMNIYYAPKATDVTPTEPKKTFPYDYYNPNPHRVDADRVDEVEETPVPTGSVGEVSHTKSNSSGTTNQTSIYSSAVKGQNRRDMILKLQKRRFQHLRKPGESYEEDPDREEDEDEDEEDDAHNKKPTNKDTGTLRQVYRNLHGTIHPAADEDEENEENAHTKKPTNKETGTLRHVYRNLHGTIQSAADEDDEGNEDNAHSKKPTNKETGTLRQVYRNLHGTIHTEADKEGDSAMQGQNVQEHEESRDDPCSAQCLDNADRAIEEQETNREYALVWQADSQELAPPTKYSDNQAIFDNDSVFEHEAEDENVGPNFSVSRDCGLENLSQEQETERNADDDADADYDDGANAVDDADDDADDAAEPHANDSDDSDDQMDLDLLCVNSDGNGHIHENEDDDEFEVPEDNDETLAEENTPQEESQPIGERVSDVEGRSHYAEEAWKDSKEVESKSSSEQYRTAYGETIDERATVDTDQMDELVSSFLVGKPEEEKEEDESSVDPREFDTAHSRTIESIVSRDQTLADSSYMSGSAGDSTIVSQSIHTKDSSVTSRSGETYDTEPEPYVEDDGSEYQVLYQISEEDEDACEEEDDRALEQDPSFEPRCDLPFDKDASTLEEYKRARGVNRFPFSRCLKLLITSAVLYYIGIVGLIFDLMMVQVFQPDTIVKTNPSPLSSDEALSFRREGVQELHVKPEL